MTGARLSPLAIIVDFENALISSCKEQFPDAQIIGCLFHLKQAWQRKMKKNWIFRR
jgi:hypothetical protein